MEKVILDAARDDCFPVVRSMYGVLLPQWLVHERKWKDAYSSQ